MMQISSDGSFNLQHKYDYFKLGQILIDWQASVHTDVQCYNWHLNNLKLWLGKEEIIILKSHMSCRRYYSNSLQETLSWVHDICLGELLDLSNFHCYIQGFWGDVWPRGGYSLPFIVYLVRWDHSKVMFISRAFQFIRHNFVFLNVSFPSSHASPSTHLPPLLFLSLSSWSELLLLQLLSIMVNFQMNKTGKNWVFDTKEPKGDNFFCCFILKNWTVTLKGGLECFRGKKFWTRPFLARSLHNIYFPCTLPFQFSQKTHAIYSTFCFIGSCYEVWIPAFS